MANIGISNASYHADTSILKLMRSVDNSVKRVASAGSNITASDSASLKGMDYSFHLDFAGTSAAIKSISVAQAHLSTALTTLDNASNILAKIQELAVLGANGSNSVASSEAIDAEAEALADELHKVMSDTKYKGVNVFDDGTSQSSLAMGIRSSGSFKTLLTQLDYDDFYDIDNPGITSLSSGVKYEIKRELTQLEKDAILTRTTGLTEEQLEVGFRFTTNDAVTNNIGNGTITIDPNGINTHNYVRGSGIQQFDLNATALALTEDFKGGFLDIEISENYENADNLSIQNAGNISIVDGKVFFRDANINGSPTIEIGEVDEVSNGENGKKLRINLHSDATVPGTSNLKNGDFSDLIQETVGYSATYNNVAKTETRDGVLGDLREGVAGPMRPIVNNIAAPTYENISLLGGSGSGARVSIKTGLDPSGNEQITQIQYLDRGKDYVRDDNLIIPDGIGTIGGTVLIVDSIDNNETVTLTVANTNNTYANAVWGDRATWAPDETGYYDFDANGDPAVGNDRLQYNPGDNKLTNPWRWVPNPNGVELDPETGARLNDIKEYRTEIVQEVTGTTYTGETTLTDSVFAGYRANTETVPEYWTRYEGRVDFGTNFTIDQFPTDAILADPLDQANELDAANGNVDTTGRIPISIPTPSEAVMAATADGLRNDNAPTTSDPTNAMSVSINGGKLKLNTSQFSFQNVPGGPYGILHGPAAVSDVFRGEAGQFLKLDYTATGTGDDYHVAGYIYRVNPDGSAASDPIMALNETGTSVNDRASVEVPETGDYRFVFVVGTYDKTGGRVAGADMTIDNIVAEDPYTIGTNAVDALLKSLHFVNNAANATPTKTLTATLSSADRSTTLTDNALINMVNFDATQETNGPYMIAPTLNLVSTPSDGANDQASQILIAKVERLQENIAEAKVDAGAKYSALESALDSLTDLSAQYSMASGKISDLNFSQESAFLTKSQIQHNVASAMLAQANLSQNDLLLLVAENSLNGPSLD